MNKQDILNQIEWHLEETEGENASGTFDQGYKEGCYHCEALIERLDEPQKVKVPQFVAEWIETAKKEKRTLHYSMQDIDDACYYHKGDDPVYQWVFGCDGSPEHQEAFARAYMDGYEVEEEPRWVVKIEDNGSAYFVDFFDELQPHLVCGLSGEVMRFDSEDKANAIVTLIECGTVEKVEE